MLDTGRMHAFLRGIRKSGWQNARIFKWYPQVWMAECLHFYMVSASLGGNAWYPQDMLVKAWVLRAGLLNMSYFASKVPSKTASKSDGFSIRPIEYVLFC